MKHGDRLAFTTDSFVVDPLEFSGGDIGKPASAARQRFAVGGARPLYLSCAAIIEEGVEVDRLRRIARFMAEAARIAGVRIVTGDTKVVGKGCCDKLFVTTTGVGVIRKGIDLGARRARPGDAVLVNGRLGDHGAAILGARGDMALESPIQSDCAPLNGLIDELLAAAPGTASCAMPRARPCLGAQRAGRGIAGGYRDRGGFDADLSAGEGLLRDPRARSALSGQ